MTNRTNGRNGNFTRITNPLRNVRMDEMAFLYDRPPLRIVRMDEMAISNEKPPISNRNNGRNGHFMQLTPHDESYEWQKWQFYTNNQPSTKRSNGRNILFIQKDPTLRIVRMDEMANLYE